MLSLKILPFYGLSIQEFFFLAFLIQHSDNRVSFFSPKNINVRKFRVKDFALHSTIGAACTPYGPLVKKKKKHPGSKVIIMLRFINPAILLKDTLNTCFQPFKFGRPKTYSAAKLVRLHLRHPEAINTS